MSKLNQKCERCRIPLPDKFGRSRPYLCTNCEILANQEKQFELSQQQLRESRRLEAENARLQEEYDQAENEWDAAQYVDEPQELQGNYGENAGPSPATVDFYKKAESLGLEPSLTEADLLSYEDMICLGQNGVKTLNDLANCDVKEFYSLMKSNRSIRIDSKKSAKEIIYKARANAVNTGSFAPKEIHFKNFKVSTVSVVLKFLSASVLLLFVSLLVVGISIDFIKDSFGDGGLGFIVLMACLLSIYGSYRFAKS